MSAPRPSTAHESETIFSELKRYVGFDADDASALAEAKPHVAPHFERIARAFYDRTRDHAEAHALFTDEAQITRLQRSLVLWLERVFSGPHDDAYFAQTSTIGRVHARLALPQRYMLSAMALIRLELVRIVAANMGDGAVKASEAIHKALDLELAGMLETFRKDTISHLETREREKSEALLRTEHRYVNAVELARVLVVGLSAEGRILLFNREAERVTGWAREELIGFFFAETLADADQGIAELIAESLSGNHEGDVMLETALRTRSGKIREMRWQLARAPSAADEVALFAIGNDVTEERELAEKHRQQEKLASLGTLAAGLAHEIRNPLNGAQLHLAFLERTLKKTAAGEEMLEAVRVVADEIKRLALLVSDFLDFARPKPLELREVSVRTLVDRALQLVASAALAEGVKLSADLPTRDVELTCDVPKIEQVLLNLLLNAIEAVRAAGRGTGSVVARVRQKPRDMLFEIEDDGAGISPASAPVFDAFYSTKTQGTGLGLSISHRIVTDHGGEISVESHPGRTVFRFTVPLRAVRSR